jgi:hypothetical protein
MLQGSPPRSETAAARHTWRRAAHETRGAMMHERLPRHPRFFLIAHWRHLSPAAAGQGAKASRTGCQAAAARCIVCAANAGVLRCTGVRGPCGVGEKYPLNLIWIMPAQGSVRISHSSSIASPLANSDYFRLVSCLAAPHRFAWRYDERQSEVPFRRRPRR